MPAFVVLPATERIDATVAEGQTGKQIKRNRGKSPTAGEAGKNGHADGCQAKFNEYMCQFVRGWIQGRS
jgi:hypothetical protein